MVKLIVALGPNNLLGKGNKMAWYIPEELQFFKKMTLNCWLLMGYKTYVGLPKSLPNRQICVASSQKRDVEHQVFNTQEIKEFINKFNNKKETLWIVGGKSIYENFYQYAQEIYVSKVKTNQQGDIYLEWDLSSYNKELFLKEKNFSVYKYTKS